MKVVKSLIRKFKINKMMANINFDKEDRRTQNNRERLAKEAFEFWYDNLNEKEFTTLRSIVDNFSYYSFTRVGDSFEKLSKTIAFKEIFNPEKTVFMPLKKHNNRTETSIGIFLPFMNALGIDSMHTSLDNSDRWLKNYIEIQNKYEGIKAENDKFLDEENNLQIEINQLNEEIRSGVYTKEEQSEKRDRIREIKKRQKAIQSEKQTRLNTVRKHHGFDIDSENVVIVDDFLCSGSSLNKFLSDTKIYIENIDKKFYFVFLEVLEEARIEIEESILRENISEKVIIIYVNKSLNYEQNVLQSEEKKSEFRKIKTELYERYNIKDDANYKVKTHVASYLNAPNTNYGFLSNKTQEEGWKYPFPRSKRG